MSVVEKNLITSLATSFSGTEAEEEAPQVHYGFNTDFQSKIAALTLFDEAFALKTHGLIDPNHFEDSAVATLVAISQDMFIKHRQLPDIVSYSQIIRDMVESGKIRNDLKNAVIRTFKALRASDMSNRDLVADKVAEFARHKAMELAMMKAADLMDKGRYDDAANLIKVASAVGVTEGGLTYDYFEEITSRTLNRKEAAAGVKPPQGITTGLKKIDDLLYHSGWGRKELSLLMGGAKSGKSTGLLFFARNSALAGYNTLYITLEMSDEIAASRIDASISNIEMKELGSNIGLVESAVRDAQTKGAARLKIVQMPGYSLTPMGLRRIIEQNAANGVRFDLIVVDYLDLMAPDFRTNDGIENSKSIYVGVRAIGQADNIAILSATQTNREGFKSITAKAEHAADDFNKIRIADITISINASDDEKANNEARLYFAASRNEASGMTVSIKNDIEKMIFIKSIIGVI